MAEGSRPVPPGTVLLHIGPQKTGSTAIQVAFKLARDELEAEGVFYATRGRPRPAVVGWALGLPQPAGASRPSIDAWESFAARVAGSRAERVFVSNEDFSRAKPELIPKILADLGGRDRVRVVLVARRLDLFLPSQWQERVKAGDQRPYDEWLRVVLDRTSDERSWDRWNVWRSHDLRLLVNRWARHIDADRISVVVLDETDRRKLPAAFEHLLGLPDGTIRPMSRINRGLTWGECEMLRGINEAFDERGWPKDVRRRFVRDQILSDLRARTPPPGRKTPPLPDWAVDTLRTISERRIAFLGERGVDLIGDLELLRVPDDVETVSGPFPEAQIPRQAVGEVVTALIAASLTAEEVEAAHVGDIGFDDEDKGAETE
jgi:hypothetical protein